MQGNIIADKIVQDANSQADAIIKKAQNTAGEYDQKFASFMTKESEALAKKIFDAEEDMSQDYKANLKIEKNKFLYRKKQEILSVIKEKALHEILAYDKKKKLKFVDTLVKYNASHKETLYINYPGLTLVDVKELPIVKKLALKVVKGSDLGLIISSDYVDKNLLFETLIDGAVEKQETEISKLLFD